ncbi:CBS domain-containing protein [Methylocystis hirsuta]|uniref:CBS domain-containing protein n=1 Tax=Methylocystis hirsuta TaxID=369798 RepID=A0A3M9XJG1_9HYPH|nr:CBS domain-containing protein [Methylocystis hirsuta]RNJ47875.1 CBS domain-containing protein [Methylocystis hirsuta]
MFHIGDLRRMRDDDVGAIPVRADGQLVGMITDRDIACRAENFPTAGASAAAHTAERLQALDRAS